MGAEHTEKLVITGAAGLVGQNLIIHLKELGYERIVAIDKHGPNLAMLERLHPDIVSVNADLSSRGRWVDHFAEASVVICLHAQIGAKDSAPFVRNNIDATRNVLDAMHEKYIPYLVHVSSSVLESVADDEYTRSKAEQERMVRESGIRHVVLRPTLMFGWFDRKHLGWLSRFMRSVPIFPIPGHGEYVRQPLYVRDFCTIIGKCLDSRPDGECFNISGLERVTYIDIIREIKKVVGARTLILRIPYRVFYFLLAIWSVFDRDPPFTKEQLEALVAGDEFEELDWPSRFGVCATPFREAMSETFNHPSYSKVELQF